MTYYVIGSDEQQYGPVDRETVEKWVQENKIGPATLSWREDEGEWSPLNRRGEFSSLFDSTRAQDALVPRREAAAPLPGGGTGGYVLIMLGSISVGAGVGISFTGFGACIGIPMALVGIPLIILGAIIRSRARDRRTDAVLAQAVASSVSRTTVPPHEDAVRCGSCGESLPTDVASCPTCGARNPRE